MNSKKRVFINYVIYYLQKCSLMFFQKNIFEDLKLNKDLKVKRTTCLILFNFQHFYFILHSSSFYYNFHWSCALTIWLSYHYIYLNIVFNLFEKSYTHSLICKTRKEKRRKRKRNERSENQLNVVFFKFVIELCWLHHKVTSINVINNENQNIDEVKINSALCFSDLLLSYADYIIKLHR